MTNTTSMADLTTSGRTYLSLDKDTLIARLENNNSTKLVVEKLDGTLRELDATLHAGVVDRSDAQISIDEFRRGSPYLSVWDNSVKSRDHRNWRKVNLDKVVSVG